MIYEKNIAVALTVAGLAVGSMAITGCSQAPQNEPSNDGHVGQIADNRNNSNSNKPAREEKQTDDATIGSRTVPTKDSIETKETIENSSAGEHVIAADGTSESYSNVLVKKSGDSNLGDEADFYGDNSAIFATNKANLSLSEMVVETNGTHANAVFSYGEGTTINISDSVIETSGNCSGGIMTTGGATMNASNLRISTSGNSSAAIRSDRGGGDVNVDGGIYSTTGTGSPAIYSTADISVKDAQLSSDGSQGIVIEGKNSVALENVEVNANNTKKNSDKSAYYQAVMIYQSMSGDAAMGASNFSMKGGKLVNENGDVFFVNNTTTTMELNGAEIVNDGDGVFLRAAAAGWGSEGKNGGQVSLKATDQAIEGDMLVDNVSSLNLYLSNSKFSGAVNPDGQGGSVYVEVPEGSIWQLSADSYITSLTCSESSIDLDGHTLYVNGNAYQQGSASTGMAIEQSSNGDGENHDTEERSGNPGDDGDGDKGNPPSAPDGNGGTAERQQQSEDVGGTIAEGSTGSVQGGDGNSHKGKPETQGNSGKAKPETAQGQDENNGDSNGTKMKEKPSGGKSQANPPENGDASKKEKRSKKAGASTTSA